MLFSLFSDESQRSWPQKWTYIMCFLSNFKIEETTKKKKFFLKLNERLILSQIYYFFKVVETPKSGTEVSMISWNILGLNIFKRPME